MRPEDPDAAYLWDMLEAAKLVASFAAGPAFQPAHAEIPWRAIVGQRNILAHDYGEIDDSRVWGVGAYRDRPVPRLAWRG
jgi:uncharacterized protein with HEPN domain